MVAESLIGVRWRGCTVGAKLMLLYTRRFPAHRGKSRLVSFILKRMFRNKLVLQTASGSRIKIDTTDFIGGQIFRRGGYEPESLALAARIMAAGGVFVDLGCNVGLYTLVVGAIPGVQCVAIDASFEALGKLKDNLDLNPEVRPTIVASAVSPESSLFWFECPEHRNLGTTRISKPHEDRDGTGFWAAGMDLNHILRRTVPGRLKLLKADLEGVELSVFRDFDFQGKFRPENILVECDPAGFRDAGACFEFLRKQRYSSRTIRGEPIESCRSLPEHNVWFRDEGI